MRFLLPALLGIFTLSACDREVPILADTIYTGGTIYTGVNDNDTVQAVAVGDGLIVYAGEMDVAIKLSKDKAKIVNIGDAFMYPGFTDAHMHLAGVGERELTLNLDQAVSIEDLKTKLLAYREAHPDLTTITGRGWIETHWPEARFPNASDLDAVVADIPVILTRADGHALVANSKAMDVAGITSDTANPAGGSILKTEDGAPDGMFIDLAMNLLGPVFADAKQADIGLAVDTGYQVYASRGWTGLHNMSVNKSQLDYLAELTRTGDVPLRTYNAVDPDLIDQAINRSPSGDRMSTRAVKIYMDGALGSRGALLFRPYADAPETKGLSLIQKDETLALFEKALAGDVQIAMHAIGDRGNKLGLDWMETAFAARPEGEAIEETEEAEPRMTGPRWRIEHAQIVRPVDQARFADLGVIASMQPSHAIGDLYFAPSRLGANRLNGAYAWKSLMEKGAVVAGGSDAPVEVGDPIIEYYAATVRKGQKDGYSDENWHREEALSRYDALKLFTQNAAIASFQEDMLGTIENGKFADFTVFDQDILTVPDEALLSTRPVMTIVGGDVIWKAE